ncbi:MAG: hypothetical protein U0169_25300 [Polyangiaceae bacterium]
MRQTKVDSELESKASAIHDDPERVEVIARARRFKASWIELAEALTRVRRSNQWKEWGYETFEDYGKKELHLRAETMSKLTGSYMFLQKKAPHVLERDGVNERIPSYQAVDFLRRAEEREDAPVDTVREIRHRVLEEAAPMPTVAKEYKDSVFPIDAKERKSKDKIAIRNVAGRLREIVASTRAVPRALSDEVAEILGRLLEAVADGDEAAA